MDWTRRCLLAATTELSSYQNRRGRDNDDVPNDVALGVGVDADASMVDVDEDFVD